MQKYLFDRSFDPEVLEAERLERLEEERRQREAEEAALQGYEPEPEPEPEPPAPTFSEEELAEARRQSFEEGRQAGEAAALASREEAILALLQSIGVETAEIAQRQQKANEDLADTAVQVALAVSARMLPRLIARHGGDEIEDLVRHCLADLMDEPRIVVRVADGMLDDIRDRTSRIKTETGYPGTFVLLADDDLAPGDSRVEWADGGAERLGSQVWRDVEQAIARVQAGNLTTSAAADAIADAEMAASTDETSALGAGADPAGPDENEQSDAAQVQRP